MEVSASLTSLTFSADTRNDLAVIFELEGRGAFTFTGLTAANVVAIVLVLSGGALSIGDDLPIPCRAQVHGGRLVALGHATGHRWAIFEDEPVVSVVRSVEDLG
jgi:hypothetical protein